ncbi:MAG: hypothetical protein ABMA13_19895 [Chthoniobacteraceae bacterium]
MAARARLAARKRDRDAGEVNRRFAIAALGAAIAHGQELPDIRSVAADLVVPPMSEGAPAAGRRVRAVTSGWENTAVYHALYLPPDWSGDGKRPVIVELPGNGGFRSAHGDECNGRPEGCNLGFGVAQDAIWVSAPFVAASGRAIAEKWWGDAPAYDPEPTLAYLRATVREVCARFGGDASRVVLAGFSRGSIAVNYIGLHDDETAKLWRAFICYSHFDGVRRWPYPGSDSAAARARLARLAGREQFICGEGANADETRKVLGSSPGFTFASTGFRNHNDAWILRPSETRAQLREWFRAVIAR